MEEKPHRKTRANRQGSKYEPIIDAFLDSGHSLARVEGTGLDANYLRVQLAKALEARGTGLIEVSEKQGSVSRKKIIKLIIPRNTIYLFNHLF